MDGQIRDGRGWVIASSFIHVSIHMEMNWIVAQCLLAHVLELHSWNMHCLKAPLHLEMTTVAQQVHLRGVADQIVASLKVTGQNNEQGEILISQAVSHQSAEAICLRVYDNLYWQSTLLQNLNKLQK